MSTPGEAVKLLSSSKREPTKIWLETLTDAQVKFIRPVTSRDIFDGMTQNFHDDGLFSTSIFGAVGDERRDTSWSYIELHVKIFRAKIFGELMNLRAFYREVITGKKTAIFNPETKDLEESDAPGSGTGYSFFVKNITKVEFKKNNSPARNDRIDLLEKYRGNWFVSRVFVNAAGLRDAEIEDGRVTKHEVNDIYAKIIGAANSVALTNDLDNAAYDSVRMLLTRLNRELYDMYLGILDGKSGQIMKNVASRSIAYGSRNVLSVIDPSVDDLDAPNAPGADSIVMGLYQVIKNLGPLSIYFLRQKFLLASFSDTEGPAKLINPKTLKMELVDVKPVTRDIWTTRDGINGLMNKFSNNAIRHRPVVIEGRYLALIYRGKDNTFRVLHDIDELPEGYDKSLVSPITYAEMFYISGYSEYNKYITSVVRYPVSGSDSVVPNKIYCKTTSIGEVRTELDENWEPVVGPKAIEFPRRDIPSFVTTQSPHSIRLKGFNADFDGDMGSATTLFSKEANAESIRYLNTVAAWRAPDGKARASIAFDTLKLVVHNLTREQHDYERQTA